MDQQEHKTNPFDRVFDRRGIKNLNKWNWYPEDVISMWVADMDFYTPQPVLAALEGALQHGNLGYEMASRSLLEIVAKRMDRLYGWAVAPEMVVPVPGVSVGIRAAASVACQPGEGLLLQPPVFHDFFNVPQATGLVRQDAPLRRVDADRRIRYRLDRAAFEQALNSGGVKTAMFLLCNPHNPVGLIYPPEDLAWIAQVCQQNEVLICSDEIHNELLLGGASLTPVAALSPAAAERTVTLLGPGKAFNMSGLECAFAIIPETTLRDRFSARLSEQGLHVNSLGLVASHAAYSGACDPWLAELRAYLTANRDYLVEFVASELPELSTTVPDGTYLAWLDCSAAIRAGKLSGPLFEFFLQKARVALNGGPDFGPGGENFVRLGFACPRSVLTEALERIKQALA